MYFAYSVAVTFPGTANYDTAVAVGRKIYPNRSVIRCFRNTTTNQLLLIVESALSIPELAQLTEISADCMTLLAGNPLSAADEYIKAHPELVPEHPNGVSTATFLQ